MDTSGWGIEVTLPATDYDRARRFWGEQLGFEVASEDPGGTNYKVGGGAFSVFPSSGQASGTHTQMGITVTDIEAVVAEMKGRGVVFEEYDTPDLKTENSIATTGPVKAAWFKDSEGNLVAVVQPPG